MEHASEKKFPVTSKDYKLYEEVGEGVSATVYRALCIPLNEMVAIKILDLEKCNNDLDGIRREVQTMTLIDHPNVLRAHCSFTADCSLWVVMPYMAGGSCLHIMKSAHPEGFEEPVIATLLHEVLKALVYLHSHGHIHRDVKAGNILIDDNGAVKLADFGVSACMFDTGDRQRSRNTFVGTPCWMAPEVMQQVHGYDFKADIWSLGITALELAHGHAPFSKYPPMKVLLMTLQNAPPGLDYERDKRFSKSFKEMVAACLVKDPKKRPTAEKLLKHHFFKHARSNEYLAQTILDGISLLGDRFRALKVREADFLLQNKVMYGDKEQKSQSEYFRGISGWNFNLEDLKTQAALDDDGISHTDVDMYNKSKEGCNDPDFGMQMVSPERVNHASSATKEEDGSHDLQNKAGPLPPFPIHPLQALKGYFDITEDDINASSPERIQSDSELPQIGSVEEQETRRKDGENFERNCSFRKNTNLVPIQQQKFLSGSLIPELVLCQSRNVTREGDRENMQQVHERSYSGPLLYHQKRDGDMHTSASMQLLEDASEGTVVQRKGRFKVTSADVVLKAVPSTNNLVNSNYGSSASAPNMAASVLSSLQYILQQNAMQREQLLKLIKCTEQAAGYNTEFEDGANEISLLAPASRRERELQAQVVYLQQRTSSLVEELQKLKMKNAQLERLLNALFNKEEEERIKRENEEQ